MVLLMIYSSLSIENSGIGTTNNKWKLSHTQALKIWMRIWYHSRLCDRSFINMSIHINVGSHRRLNGGIIFQFNVVGEREWFLVVDH